jgi:hypothetical protein
MSQRLSLLVLLTSFALAAALGARAQEAAPRAPSGATPRLVEAVRPPGPSPIVYPPQVLALRMDHAHPAHRELACVRCHAAAPASEDAGDRLLPEEARCGPCHADDLDRDGGDCAVCHVGWTPERPLIGASRLPPNRLHFSHRAHRETACVDCHRGVREVAMATRAQLPTMRDCFECHAPAGFGREATAPAQCSTCHLADPDGRLRQRFSEGVMNPPGWLFDMRHDHEWLVRHRWVGADQGPACASCHRERDCVECHDGRVRPVRAHPGDYLAAHPLEARRDEGRCQSCHTISRFCAECHSRLGISTLSAPAIEPVGAYHPPPAIWLRGPNLHAVEAVRALDSCASCHGEQDCVECHGARGFGGGLSPHPPGFATRCATALAINGRACATCHGDLEALRMRCR